VTAQRESSRRTAFALLIRVSISSLLVPSAVTCEYYIKILELSTCCSVLPFICSRHYLGFLERHNTRSFLKPSFSHWPSSSTVVFFAVQLTFRLCCVTDVSAQGKIMDARQSRQRAVYEASRNGDNESAQKVLRVLLQSVLTRLDPVKMRYENTLDSYRREFRECS